MGVKLLKKPYKKIIAVLLIVFTLTAPKMLADDLGQDICYQWLKGSKPVWTGIVHIWNVSTWQVGKGNAASWLEKKSRSFEKRNSGIYISVENITAEEYKKRTENGEKPDILSFGTGFINNPQDIFETISLPNKIKSGVNDSALYLNKAYSMPYMMGAYGIYINEELLQSAGIDYLDVSAGGIALKDLNEVLGILKTESKQGIYPLVYNINNINLTPLSLVYLYTGDGVDETGDLFKNLDSVASANENAYKTFTGGKAVMLLASQKTANDLNNESSISFSFVTTGISAYSDMVQYLGIIKTDDPNKKEMLNQYLNYIVRDDVQDTLNEIGVFSVIRDLAVMDEDPNLSSYEQAILHDAIVPNTFTWSKEKNNLAESVNLFLKGDTSKINSIKSILGSLQ